MDGHMDNVGLEGFEKYLQAKVAVRTRGVYSRAVRRFLQYLNGRPLTLQNFEAYLGHL